MRTLSAFLKTIVCLSLLAFTTPAFSATQNFVFRNTTPITLNDAGSGLVVTQAVLYPSPITVSGLGGNKISKITVTLNGLCHTYSDDVDILLVGPMGTNIVLLSDSGGSSDANGLSLTFDDNAASTTPDATQLVSGTYKRSSFGSADTFPAPAPAPSAATNLAAFNGTDPNGVWNLYVVDDEGGDAGSISGGWSLDLAVVDDATFAGGAITINSNGVATPYPSSISVLGLSGSVAKLTVRLNGFTHSFPDDVDMLLVGPSGTNAIIFSDVGGGIDATNWTIVLDDAAPTSLSDIGPLTNGTFQPANFGASETFPSPAPVPSGGSALSAFNGTDPNGMWNLYVMDDATGDGGSISNWSLTITTTVNSAKPGELIISEFRLRGTNGPYDEFVEIYNTNDVNHVVNSIDGSPGYALAASDGVARFVISNGTVIPAHGHFLGANSVGYAIGGYPAGSGTNADGDATFTNDIPDNTGLALFRTANPASFILANRLDAVGSTTETNTLYKEGAGCPALAIYAIDSAFYRNLTNGIPKDTDVNANDFLFVDTSGTSAGAGQRLGAPGPENLTSPIWLPRGPSLVRALLDSSVALSATPNHEKDPTSDPAHNANAGKLFLRRKFTNYSGNSLTRLRFRIVDITTFPSSPGTADLRPISYTNVVVSVNGVDTTVLGATLEQPPSQLYGGGFNSTFSVTNVTSATPLANGGSVNVQFTCGLQQDGNFRLALIPETFPAAASEVWFISGSTYSNVDVEVTAPPTMASVYSTTLPDLKDVKVRFTTSPGRLYQLERRTNVNSGAWTDTGVPFVGTGYLLEATHPNGRGLGSQFYRQRVIP